MTYLTANDRHYVHKVLEMHLAIRQALARGRRFPPSHTWVGEYKGFDGLHEGDLLTYAKELVGEDGSPLGVLAPQTHDAHSSATWRYKPMLEAWIAIGSPDELTDNDLRSIAEAVEASKPLDERKKVE